VDAPSGYDGVIIDASGRVRALWSSFATESGRELVQISRGVSVELALEAVEAVRTGRDLHSLEVEFETMPVATARKLGLSEEWVAILESRDTRHRQVLSVGRLVAGSPAAAVLRPGDLLLAVDGRPLNRFREVEKATQAPRVSLSVLRDGQELELEVETVRLDGRNIDRLLLWAGAVLHAPHRAMAVQRGIPPEGVFVAYFSYGSPATRYELFAGRRILEVDGRATPDLDAFIAAVQGRQDRQSLRLRTVSWNGAVDVITLKLDKHYWPAYELRRSQDGWQRNAID
jgi:S1-C subfamily serine protease